MTAPTKAWVTITDGMVDADSPVDTTLMTGLRDDLVHLKEWIGKDFTSAQNHTHNGVDSAMVVLTDNGVTLPKINRSSYFELFDDFLFGTLDARWTTAGTPTFPSNETGGAIDLGTSIYSGDSNPFKLGSGETVFETRVKTTSAPSGTAVFTAGLCASAFSGSVPGVSVAFMRYGNSNNKWSAVTKLASLSSTITELDVNIGTTYQVLKIVATTTSVKFYIDGVLKATHTTNITPDNMGVSLYGAMRADYVRAYSPR